MMSEAPEAAEGAVEDEAAAEEASTDEVVAEEATADDATAEAAAEETGNEQPADEPTAEQPAEAEAAAEETADADAEEDEPGTLVEPEEDGATDIGEPAEEGPEQELSAVGLASRRASVFFCDRGHRTFAVWSQPEVCHARPARHGEECGRPLHSITELPEQVQKALNPLKASKKAAKGAA
jgi:hypothetical protein